MSRNVNADLAAAGYLPPQFKPDGSPADVLAGGGKFFVVDYMDRHSGYQGTLFKNRTTGDYVLVNRGTEFDREPVKDGVTDAGMVLTRGNLQIKDALEFAGRAVALAERDGKHLSVAGHSLGGGISQVLSHHYNLPGEAFNPYGAASLGYRVPEGQPANGARFVNHVMAGDFVSAGAGHYGTVEVYAKPSELKTLQNAEFASRLMGGMAGEISRPFSALALGDSHRMKHFIDHVENGVEVKSVLDDPSARIKDPEDQRRVDAYRESVYSVRAVATVASRPLILEAANILRGTDEPGAYAERQARAAELAAHPFNPAKARSESSSDGGPMRENPSFHSQSPLEQRLNDLLNADPDRFKVLNQQMSKLDAGQALDSQVRNQASAEDRAREHAQTSTQQATQQEHSASAMGR